MSALGTLRMFLMSGLGTELPGGRLPLSCPCPLCLLESRGHLRGGGKSPSFCVQSLLAQGERHTEERPPKYIKLPKGLQGWESWASNQVLTLTYEVWKWLSRLASETHQVHS